VGNPAYSEQYFNLVLQISARRKRKMYCSSRHGSYISGEGLKPITWKMILLRSGCRCGLIDMGSSPPHMML
jgi:hypothetical protein